jgi:DNA gyrase inhibitor GyrI
MMSEKEVKIVELKPMKVAKFYGFSETPENDAFTAADKWLKDHGLQKKGAYRNFGFNNPNPSAGSPKYGYEVWILPNDGLPDDGNTEIVEFPGGLYAVSLCSNLDTIGADWQKLVAWRDTSEYQHASHQWLEEVIDPPVSVEELRLLLYLPISR